MTRDSGEPTKKFEEQYTKYEKARILGARALQISANAPILIKLSKEELQKLNYDPIKIAELEFQAGVLPITVKRPLPKKVEKKKEEFREIVKEEKEIPKALEREAETIPGEQAKIEEAEEAEAEGAEAEEIGGGEFSEEAVIEEFGKEEGEEEV